MNLNEAEILVKQMDAHTALNVADTNISELKIKK